MMGALGLGRLDRYVMLAILGLSAVVGLGLVSLYSFISFITEIDRGSDELGVTQIFVITLMTMPAGLYVLMPLVAMLGTLLGVGQLAAQSEITAMRAAGYSNLRLGRSAMLAGLLLGALAVGIGETVAPAGQQAAERLKSGSRSLADGEASVGPVWLRDGPNVYFIRRVLAADRFADAEIYRLDDTLNLTAMLAVERGRFREGSWVLEDVAETRFGGERIEVLHHQRLDWPSGIDPEVLELYVLEADTLSITGLMRLIRYLRENGLDTRDQQLELWRKAVAPITVMAMVLFAVPFVFGPTRGGGAGQRLLIGVLVGIGFHLLNEVSANFGALYGWPAPLAAALPTGLMTAIGAVRLGLAR